MATDVIGAEDSDVRTDVKGLGPKRVDDDIVDRSIRKVGADVDPIRTIVCRSINVRGRNRGHLVTRESYIGDRGIFGIHSHPGYPTVGKRGVDPMPVDAAVGGDPDLASGSTGVNDLVVA